MNKNINRDNVIRFIELNGWTVSYIEDDCISYWKDDCIGIDLTDDDIVLIDDTGDFMYITLNYLCLYILTGFLIMHDIIKATDLKLSTISQGEELKKGEYI